MHDTPASAVGWQAPPTVAETAVAPGLLSNLANHTVELRSATQDLRDRLQNLAERLNLPHIPESSKQANPPLDSPSGPGPIHAAQDQLTLLREALANCAYQLCRLEQL